MGLFTSRQEKQFKKYLRSIGFNKLAALGVASISYKEANKNGITPDVFMHEFEVELKEAIKEDYLDIKGIIQGDFGGPALEGMLGGIHARVLTKLNK